PRLPHLPGSPLLVHGRDPSLCRLDHCHRLSDRPHPPHRLGPSLPVGPPEGGRAVRRVSVENLCMSYDDAPVLERVNLDVPSGTFCALVGASGCGKSTFLRLLLSQERPSRGAIRLDGEPVAPEPTPDRGVVFQKYSVFPHLTVCENLILPA